MYRFALHAGVLALVAASLPALAQPAPSFRVECSGLREALARLGSRIDEELLVGDVVGTLTAVEHDGTLGYMFMCEAPNPRVLCVTYQVNDYKVGDRASLAGTLTVLDEDHVRLDPCLHYPADAGERQTLLP